MYNLERICRICLKTETQPEYINIFSKGNEIALKINLISGIKIVDLSELFGPSLICSTCLKELYQCLLFRKKCQSSDEYFKTKTFDVETQLYENDAESEFLNTKFEPICYEQNIEEISSQTYELKEEADDQFGENIDEDIEDVADLNEFAVSHENQKPMNMRRQGRVKQLSSKISELKRNSLQCKYCGIFLSRRNRRIEHERLHLLQENQLFYECFFCGKSFNQKLGLLPHFQKNHNYIKGPKERWKCAICTDKVLPPGNLALHYEKEHSSFKTGVSSVSTYFGRKTLPIARPIKPRLKKESRKRTLIKPTKPPQNFWPCSICGNSFINYQRYQKHLKEFHAVQGIEIIEESPPDKCLLVTKNMEADSDVSKDARKLPCTTCGKVFASVMTVRAHEKTHLNIEYICDLCGSSFRVKAYLTAHCQKVHMKLKKFKCSIENCSASFVHRELLNYHVKKHLNIRNFPCRYCGKTFLTRSCCKIHERIHTDERPYSCKYCDRTFIHHSDHRRHEKKHLSLNFRTESEFSNEKHEKFSIVQT